MRKPVSELEYYRLMSLVERPGRYAGGERGARAKDWGAREIKLRCAVCFPEPYEIGMSYLGTAILYHIINRRGDALAERCFAPGDDMYRLLANGDGAARARDDRGDSRARLWSLESRMPLDAFDAVLFSFTYELSYLQFLRMLHAGGIPLRSCDRGDDDPIVLGGGGCMANPEPIADFIDAFGIGDAEALLDPMLDCLIATVGAPRASRLTALARIPGVYVPSIDSADPVVRQFAPDLDDCPIPVDYPMPGIESVADRAVIEVMRGCPQGCRFCQAGYTYRPARARSAEKTIAAARAMIAATGYSEITLQSLSTLDHPDIVRILTELRATFDPLRVSVGLPSLRMDALSRDLARAMRRPRESSLTFAIEAGSQRLRDAINKHITEDDIFATLDAVLEAGFHKFKIYFMCGFAGETMDDIVELGDLIVRMHGFMRTRSRRPMSLHVAQSVLIPKPVTPMQRQPMERPEVTREKQFYLKRLLKSLNNVRFNYHDVGASLLEALFSRGDRRLAGALLDALDRDFLPPTIVNGNLDPAPWFELAREHGVDTDEILFAERAADTPLPWSRIHYGITDNFLAREAAKYDRAELTDNCDEKCAACGLRCGGK